MSFYDSLIGVEEKPPKVERRIWLNRKVWFDLRDEIDHKSPENSIYGALHFLLVGQSGSGKSFAGSVLANQFDAGIIIDHNDAFLKTVKEQKERKRWKFYRVYADRYKRLHSRDAFLLNLSDMGTNSASALELTSYDKSSRKMREMAKALVEWFSNPNKKEKTFRKFFSFAMQFEMGEELIKEFSLIFSETDTGIPIQQVMDQHSVVYAHESPFTNRCLGMMVGAFLDFRFANPKLCGKKFLVGIDEADSHARSEQPLGKTIRLVFKQGRKRNISGLLMGITGSCIDSEIKPTINVNVFFPVEYGRQAIEKNYSVVLHPQKFDEIRQMAVLDGFPKPDKGNCVIRSELLRSEWGFPCHFSLDYQNLGVDESMVVDRGVDVRLLRGLLG